MPTTINLPKVQAAIKEAETRKGVVPAEIVRRLTRATGPTPTR